MYRKKGEVMKFDTNNPIGRLRSYMVKQGWWDDDQENQWKEESKKMVRPTKWWVSARILACYKN